MRSISCLICLDLGVGFPEAGVLAICGEKRSEASNETYGECTISVTRKAAGKN